MDFDDTKHLLEEYVQSLNDLDDYSIARWMCQTLGQLEGRAWRMSHPLLGAYRIFAEAANLRQIWLKRLAEAPRAYAQAQCCRAPVLPLLNRDVEESGLLCSHCSATLIALEEVPDPARSRILRWAREYREVHAVAHWDETQQAGTDYDTEFETAATKAEGLLKKCGLRLTGLLLEHYPAVVWEDQDECLEVGPHDVDLS